MIKIKKILFPSLYTIGIILFGTLIVSILYYFNIVGEKINQILIYLIGIISIFTGSLMLGKKTSKKGLITGLIYFGIFIILFTLINAVSFKTSFSFKMIIYYAVLLLFSLLGSITGKNMQIIEKNN